MRSKAWDFQTLIINKDTGPDEWLGIEPPNPFARREFDEADWDALELTLYRLNREPVGRFIIALIKRIHELEEEANMDRH